MNVISVTGSDDSKYKYTKKCTKDAVIAANIAGAGYYSLHKMYMGTLSFLPYSGKRRVISVLNNDFSKGAPDRMIHSTVSKELKKAGATLKNPKIIALVNVVAAVAGGIAGACADCIRSKNKV